MVAEEIAGKVEWRRPRDEAREGAGQGRQRVRLMDVLDELETADTSDR